MHLPPIHTVSTLDIFVSGDVTIHEGAVVAPGVILQAAPDSRIIVGEGACVGMGVILNAYGGNIEIKSGAVLGAGVLIIGQVEIGHQACIGATTTLLNTSIEAMKVIPAGSLLGDRSRQVILDAELLEASEGTKQAFSGSEHRLGEPLSDPFDEEEMEAGVRRATEARASTENQPPVVGQVHINHLLFTLFPERRHSPNNSNQNHQPRKKE